MRWIGNLAPTPTTFYGRTDDLRRLGDWLAEGGRLLTLVGPAGVGKTRLARRFAERTGETGRFNGGVWFCDLTDARDLASVVSAMGRAFDITLAQAPTVERAVDTLAQMVATRGTTLLVIDNCEQVVECAARVVGRIMELATEAVLVATSRESLRVVGEQVHHVPTLSVEADPSRGLSEAVRLFVDRAKCVWPTFAPRPDEYASLEEIVRRLDGLPLAIELAASRIGALSLGTLRQRLEERFSLLAGGTRFATERQRTMRGAIDWSWELLLPEEQRLLAECAVFRGGFSLEAAEQISSTAEATLDRLQSLSQKSLLVVEDVPESGARRYRLLESIREYAWDKLEKSGDLAAAIDRHRRHFADSGLAWAKKAKLGATKEPSARLSLELENLLFAHRHALLAATSSVSAANDAFSLLVAISEVLVRRGPHDLLITLLDSTLADSVCSRADPARVAQALRERAYSRQFSPGASAAKAADLTRALAIARSTGDVQLELDCLSVYASVELLDGRPQAALANVKVALSRARTTGEPRAIAKAHADMGSCELSLGHFEEARASLKEAIALSKKAGEQLACAHHLGRLAEVSIELGRLDEASACVEEGLTLSRPFADQRLLAMLSGVQAAVEYERRDLPRARAHVDEALGFARQWGAELLEPIYRALRAAVLADEDDIVQATTELDYSEAQLSRFEDASVLRAYVSAGRGHVDLARARASRLAGDAGASERLRASAERRLDELLAIDRVFEDLRPMRRWLARELSRMTDPELAPSEHPPRADALVVAEDGQWFQPPGGDRVDLGHRPNLKRLLVSLTTRRVHARGEPMSIDEVFRRGWPGDRALASSAANRVRVAMTRLRKIGLGEALLTRDGYLLDPNLPVVIARGLDRDQVR